MIDVINKSTMYIGTRLGGGVEGGGVGGKGVVGG